MQNSSFQGGPLSSDWSRRLEINIEILKWKMKVLCIKHSEFDLETANVSS